MRNKELGSNTIFKGNIDEIVTFVKFSGENSERVTARKFLLLMHGEAPMLPLDFKKWQCPLLFCFF